jgi:hypothetical protein
MLQDRFMLPSHPSALCESDLDAAQRERIPEEEFGLPEEKKYPLHDAAHVRSAIAYFRHCPEGKKKKLAQRIMAAARKHGVEVSPDSEVAKAAA